MYLPTREQAEDFFDDFHVPNNIKDHCFMVNRISVFLAEELKAKGEKMDLDLVDRLSLLHDLLKPIVIVDLHTDPKFKCYPTQKQIDFWKKMQEKYKGKHETQIFAELFSQEFPEFAELMLHYGDHDLLTSQKSREEQIVHYADWRVFLDTIVSLKQRTDDLFIRYEKKILARLDGKKMWEKRLADEFAVEKSIFHKLDIDPLDLSKILFPKK